MASVSKQGKLLHIEAEGGIINIREGLTDVKGRKVTSIEIIPDDRFAGEPIWKVNPKRARNVRLIQTKKRA